MQCDIDLGCSEGVCQSCCSDLAHFVSNATAACEECVLQRCNEEYVCNAAVCNQQCMQHCWSKLGSAPPCIKACVSCDGVWTAVAVVLPFAGRFLVDFLKTRLQEVVGPCLKNNCGCLRTPAEEETASMKFKKGQGPLARPLLVAPGKPAFTMLDLCRSGGGQWAAARDAGTGLSPCDAVFQAVGRLIGWHLAQPVSYFVVFACAYQKLNSLQKWLGAAVAVREGLYVLMVLVCVRINPAFLLVDVGATVQQTKSEFADAVKASHGSKPPKFSPGGLEMHGYGFLFMYVLAPEKFVMFALLFGGGLATNKSLGALTPACVFGLTVLDLCGLGALGAGIGVGDLPAALAVGYSVTTLGALWMVGLVVANGDGIVGLCATMCCMVPAFVVPLVIGFFHPWSDSSNSY